MSQPSKNVVEAIDRIREALKPSPDSSPSKNLVQALDRLRETL